MSNSPSIATQPLTAADICARFTLMNEACALLREGMTPGAFLAALMANRQYVAAIEFLAHALAPRAAVWWGCLCLQHACGAFLSPPDYAALQAATVWVVWPQEAYRANAQGLGQAAGVASPAGLLAIAAGAVDASGPVPIPPATAVAIRARHPIFALRCLRDTNARIILNHRLGPDLPTGHYSVLVDVGQLDVTLHDPYFGPPRRLSHSELMQLWEPGVNTEIAGETLIAISAREETPAACEICQTPIPASVACPQCGKPVGLRPATGIGCIGQACVVRHWLNVCCPNCDYMWNFAEGAPAAAPSAPQKSEEAEDPFQLGKVFVELDKFCAAIVAMPLAAKNPKVVEHIELMKGSKVKLTEAAAQEIAKMNSDRAQMDALVQKAKAAQEAHKKKLEELDTPPPPLDGNALAQTLLKNMGLIRRTGLTDILEIPQ